MNIKKKYSKIITYDDLMFFNNLLIPHSLPINLYLKNHNNFKYLNSKLKNKPSRIEKKLDNIYLFIFNRGNKSGGNYYHFIYHYLQKLIGYFELDNIKIGLPLNMLSFQKELLLKLIPNEKIIYLDIYRYNYIIENCYIGMYQNASKLPDFLFNKLQNLYNLNYLNIYNENIVFIKRRENDNAGKNRFMTNEENFLNFLSHNNIKLFYFEDFTMEQKIINFINLRPKVIIMEIGSGIINFIFFKKHLLKNIKFIIIDHNEWKLNNCNRFKNIFNILDISYKVLSCKTIYNNLEVDIRNNPFEINITDFSVLLNNLL